MAVKKAAAQIKLQVKAGEANPAPPIGPALGHRIHVGADLGNMVSDALTLPLENFVARQHPAAQRR